MPNKSFVITKKRSKKKIIFWLSAFITLVFVVVEAIVGIDKPVNPERIPASLKIDTKKLSIIDTTPILRIAHTQKLKGPFDLKIESDQKAPDGPLSPMRLKGIVRTSLKMDRVVVSWKIPDGVELVNGSEETTLLQLKPNEPQVVEITIQPKTKKNHQVHMTVETKMGGSQLSDVTQFNTRYQKYIMDSQKRLVQRQ